MGKASREKQENRLAELATPAIAVKEAPTTAIGWLRSIGAGAILLGGAGLIEPLFLFSVITIYLGLVILMLDLWFESVKPIAKLLIYLVMLGVGALFTFFVVLRNDPLIVNYRVAGDGTVHIYVSNFTNDDYRDVDLRVRLDPRFSVIDAMQITRIENVSFFPAIPGWMLDGDKVRALPPSLPPGVSPPTRFDMRMFGNYQRFNCEELPHQSTLEIALILRDGDHFDRFNGEIEKISLSGEYKGKFRTFIAPYVIEPFTLQ